ncbi:MAG: hypothetical protein HY291_19050 [Planctomycetes bacterium]|nr:hypothetical protein [Planctomycetota bacterium]
MRGLRATLLSGSALIALSFFLPTFGGCWNVKPSEVFLSSFENPSELEPESDAPEARARELLRISSIRACLFFPYLHALLIACGALVAWRAQKSARTRAVAGLAALAAAGTCAALGVACLGVDTHEGPNTEVFREPLVPVVLISWLLTGVCILFGRSAKDARAALLWFAAAGALPAAGWFAFLAANQEVDLAQNYGWSIAVAGLALMLLAGIIGLRAMRPVPARPPATPAAPS